MTLKMNPSIPRIPYRDDNTLEDNILDLLLRRKKKYPEVYNFWLRNPQVINLSEPNKGNGSLTLCFTKFWREDGVSRTTAWFQLTRERAVWTNYQVPNPCQSSECLDCKPANLCMWR